jgi:hypothetical protein
MKVIAKNISYSQTQIKRNVTKKYIIFSVILIFSVVLLKYSFYSLTKSRGWLDEKFISLIIGLIFGIFVGLIIPRLSNKLDSFFDKIDLEINIAKAGDKGEKLIYEELDKILDDNYTVYPNYIIPGHKFDLDFLIIGPKGVIVMEVKNFSNSTLFSEDQVLSIKDSNDSQYKKEVTKLVGRADPRVKINSHCKVLHDYLNYLHIPNINIKKVLVFTKDHVIIEGKPGIYIVKKIYELNKYFNDLYVDGRFTTEFCDEMNKKLS